MHYTMTTKSGPRIIYSLDVKEKLSWSIMTYLAVLKNFPSLFSNRGTNCVVVTIEILTENIAAFHKTTGSYC